MQSGSVPENALAFTDFQWGAFHLDESRHLGQVPHAAVCKRDLFVSATYRQPRAGATVVRMASRTCAL